MKRFIYSIVPLLVLLITSCYRETEPFLNGPGFDGTGYRPLYATATELTHVQTAPARALKNPGKIYVLGNYLFVNEMGTGIHILDNTDPSTPVNLSFVAIPGNYDLAVKGTWLYADNGPDLLVFNVANPRQVQLSKRIKDAIPANNYPPHQDVYFECADPKQGIVVGWEKVTMATRPSCFR
ncbi:hypothetical protein GCM10027275_38330 [Rhabdobacter roseus]|uniref:LVIVD repeat-containing protein n=1 Tax=Rhabdobacter roseus TaxID=1655419 RepID=A0A840U1M7_9BACT|nr:hypothetical protein [Rhabdobacter roseus]MBB5285759.1 hypothetical protein [Rhabdobacter roseus]